MKNTPWDQRMARILIRPLVNSPVTPNLISAITLIGALTGAGLLTVGEPTLSNWGAAIFVLSRFLDHCDGELAREQGTTSQLGYYLDYASGGIGYGALFLCLGIGFRDGLLGPWAIILGAAGAAGAILSVFFNLRIDKENATEIGTENDSVGYPAFAGFELEDGIYLLAPITWFGYLEPFFIAAAISAILYTAGKLVHILSFQNKKSP